MGSCCIFSNRNMVTLLLFGAQFILQTAQSENTKDQKPSCNEAIWCLFDLADLTTVLSEFTSASLIRLGLPENHDKLTKTCNAFADYKKCMKKEQNDGANCEINQLQRLAHTANDLVCDDYLNRLVHRNEPCIQELSNSTEYHNCTKSVEALVDVNSLSDLMLENDSQKCKVYRDLQQYERCARKVTEKVCDHNAKEMTIYFKQKVDNCVSRNGCGILTKSTSEKLQKPSRSDAPLTSQRKDRPTGCGIVPMPKNGMIEVNNGRFITYTCNVGFKKKKERPIYCNLKSGVWNGRPTCIALNDRGKE